METASARETGAPRRSSGAGVLAGAAVGSLALGLAVAATGALLDGERAAYGALVGSVLAVVVFAFGAFTVNVVAGLMPSASLAVALLTYTLQLLVVVVVLVGLERSPAAGEELADGWLTGGLVATVLAWLVVQVVLAARARIPLYDLPRTPARAGGES
ncbi:hypothetical protein [Nocardioides sp. SYSU DS0663]|uniref:hypothetical protein n=1 Tax=Nocardioides sp. SYSU DS0663 TaxID=3416445 RepID=UPI003F4B7DDB